MYIEAPLVVLQHQTKRIVQDLGGIYHSFFYMLTKPQRKSIPMSKVLLDAAKNLWRDKHFVDCDIIVGTTKFKCHKVILANASEFFRQMFLGATSIEDITLDNTSCTTFKKFLEYIYTYDKNMLNAINTDSIIELFSCANLWSVPSLQDDCLAILIDRADSMKVEGLIDLFELGHNFNNDSLIKEVTAILLKKQVKHLFCERALRLSNAVFAHYMAMTPKYKREILRYKMIERYLEFNGFLEDLQSKENSSSLIDNKENVQPVEMEMNNNILQDAKHTKQNKENMEQSDMSNTESAIEHDKDEYQESREKYVQELFRQINFSVMSGDEFYEGPGKSKFLTLEVKYEKLYKIQCSRIRNLNNLLNQYRAM